MFNIYGAHAVYVCVFPHTLSLSHSISLHLSLCLSASLTNAFTYRFLLHTNILTNRYPTKTILKRRFNLRLRL